MVSSRLIALGLAVHCTELAVSYTGVSSDIKLFGQ